MALRRPIVATVIAGLLSSASSLLAVPAWSDIPSAKHIFVINLENKGYEETWGPASTAPYLSQTLRSQGTLLSNYYSIGHNSLANYVAQVSGQAPNFGTQADCPLYVPFVGIGTAPHGQAIGQGCVYPPSVTTIADQLTGAGLTWKSYNGGMTTPCQHPALWSADPNVRATAGDEYATRHNPLVYFDSVTQGPSCTANDLPMDRLTGDLSGEARTANVSFLSPDLCDDGHDAPCADGRPGGLASADAWLRSEIPAIMASPAYRDNGMIVITFDESDGPTSDSSACCGEQAGPNAPLPGILGPGGGRVGALVLSPHTTPGATDPTPYNHYSLLRTLEDSFGLAPLGFADTAVDFTVDALSPGALVTGGRNSSGTWWQTGPDNGFFSVHPGTTDINPDLDLRRALRIATATTPDGSTVFSVLTGPDQNEYLQVQHTTKSPGQQYVGFQHLPGNAGAPYFAARRIAVAATVDGNAEITAIGLDGNLYHTVYNATSDTFQSAWGNLQLAATDVAITAMPTGETQVAAIGTDGNLWHRLRHADGTWTPFVQIPDSLVGVPATRVAITADPATADTHVIVTNKVGYILDRTRYASDGHWSTNGDGVNPWNLIGQPTPTTAITATEISATTTPDHTTHLALLTTSGQVDYQYLDPATHIWTSPAPAPGAFGPAQSLALTNSPVLDATLLSTVQSSPAH